MYSLYNHNTPTTQGVLKIQDWIYVSNGLEKNLNTVIKYYRFNPMAVHSDHFLVKLLQSITIPQSQITERYYNNVDTMSLNLSMELKMTSSIFRGSLFNGIFFSKDTDEILIADDSSIDPFTEIEDWQNIKAVNILSSPRSDLGLNLLDGTNTGIEDGIAVINIHIPLLALQYRSFRLNEDKINTDNKIMDNTLSIMHFIHMYVLPNMLYSYLDHAVFNRISNLELGLPLGVSKKKHPFYLPDYSAKLQYVHTTILDVLKKENKDFNGILLNIPMVNNKNAAELMQIPDMALTRQLLWSLVIARLPELKFLCRLSKDSIGNKNQSEINRIVRYFLNYKSDNSIKSMLPLDRYLDVADDMEVIAKLVK